ncbi:MAG: YfhO family protein, partial [Pyrinomonadaceae bacterium]
PTAEVARQSVRVGYSFSDFVSHSLPPRQILLQIFPGIFGALREAGAPPYFGAENQTELTGYVGLLPLMLAVIGFIKWPERRLVIFWLSTALLAMVLAMGDATPLARLTYHIPILNQFRAPGRHLLESTFAITVLAGLGIGRFSRQPSPTSLTFKVVAFSGLVMLICILLVILNLDTFVALAAQKNISRAAVVAWTKQAIVVPVLIFAMTASVLLYWSRAPFSFWRKVLLLLVLVIDLASFGWFYQWRYSPLNEKQLVPPTIALRYKEVLRQSNQRLLPSRGTFAELTEMPPNLSRLWGVPSASGYNSLILLRPSRLLALSDVGVVTAPLWWEPNDQSLNVASVRYLFLPHGETTNNLGTVWN